MDRAAQFLQVGRRCNRLLLSVLMRRFIRLRLILTGLVIRLTVRFGPQEQGASKVNVLQILFDETL